MALHAITEYESTHESTHEATHEATPTFDHMLAVEVTGFHERYQRFLMVLVVTLAWAAGLRYVVLAAWPATDRPNLPALLSILATLIAGYALRGKTSLSLTLLLAGRGRSVTWEAVTHPGSPALFLYTPLIMLISAVASTSVLVTCGVACGMALFTLTWGQLNSLDAFLAPGITLACATVCAWIASRPIFDSLTMALYSAQDAMRARDELREQRRQLAQSVKALDEALYRLNRLNASLIIARQQAEEARQLKVRFANMISHEIRTPLNIIISFSEVIANAPESYGMREWPPTLREDVNEIYRSGKHLLGLINDVLDLAQIEANRVILKKERTSLLDVVDQAVSLAHKWFDHAGLYLRTAVVGDIPELQVDRIRIRQVILNLLSNARHYTAAGGVTVRVECTTSEVVISVKDTGLGIAPENLHHLFDEFQKSGEPVDDSSGSGLGLAISRMFIELHGGRMWAESEGIPGQGTTVYFTLPLPSVNVASEPPPSARDVEFWQSRYDQARSERVILIACDDATVLRVVGRLLNNQGKVLTSSIGGVAQAALQHQPDVVVAFTGDGNAPLPAALRAIELPAGAPLVTCRLDRSPALASRDTLSAEDANIWLLKPVTRDDLADAVRAVAPNARVVLSVEDDLTMARFYELSLVSDKRFMTIPSFTNVTRASEVMPLLEELVPDVILLDLNLAEGSGWDVLAAVRARWSREQLPIIMVTAMDRYGLPVLRAREVVIHRSEALSQRQTVLCLQNVLESVLS